MSSGLRRVLTVAAVWACVTLAAGPAAAGELRFQDGRWRLELSGVAGVYSGKVDRHGDAFLTGSVEYEVPAFSGGTLGLRLYPLFVYYEHEDADTIYGGGVGLVLRRYRNKETLDGLYAELGGGLLGMSDQLDGNSSHVNFLVDVGLGYQFPSNHWHLALKYQHISNGGVTTQNSGANGAALSIGYTF